MRHVLFFFLIILSFVVSPVLADTQDCEIGESTYRPGDPEDPDDCAYTSPQKPHKKINDYPLTCIPASSITYTQNTTDPDSIPSQVIVNLTVDLSQAQLGGFGPSQSAINLNTPDQLAQKYLFNALFDKPISLNSTSPDRESFRTYWRLLTSYQQANAKAIYLDQAKPHPINQIIKLLPSFNPKLDLFPITNYIVNNHQFSFSSAINLFRTLNNTFTFGISYQEGIAAIQNNEISLRATMNNHIITYYNSHNKEKEITAKELADKLDNLGGTLPGCLRTAPVCKNYQERYLNLDSDTKAAYDALLPFNFDNTQGYLVLRNSIVEENLPFLKAINQGLNERHTGLMYTLSPSWMQSEIQDQLINLKPGKLSQNTIISKASNYICTSTPQDLLDYLDSPQTHPSNLSSSGPASLSQSITFTNLEQTGKEKIDTNKYCSGATYCSYFTTQSTCQQVQYSCSWVSEPVYEYTYTAQGQGDPIVVLNSPLVDNITNSIVSGATSLYKMLLPSYAQEPEKRIIDAPTSDFSATSTQPNSSVSVTTSDGSNTMPIYRESNLAQDSLCTLQNKWLIPDGLQRSSVCPGVFPEDQTSDEINCNQDVSTISYPGILNKANTYSLATRWIGGRGHNHVNECYNDVVSRSIKAGIHPGMSLIIWINESVASNYTAFNFPIQDFGVNDTSIERNFDAQITRFLNLPQRYLTHYSYCFDYNRTQGYDDMQTFFHLFRSGQSGNPNDLQGCIPNQDSADYYNGMLTKWTWIAPNLPFPEYPTDIN